MSVALRWIGGEGQFVAGYPAADLEVETTAEAEALVAGGCYEHAESAAAESPAPIGAAATGAKDSASRDSRARGGTVSEE